MGIADRSGMHLAGHCVANAQPGAVFADAELRLYSALRRDFGSCWKSASFQRVTPHLPVACIDLADWHCSVSFVSAIYAPVGVCSAQFGSKPELGVAHSRKAS